MEIKLSILIATMPKRDQMLGNLLEYLNRQKTDDVEIITDDSPKCIGAKRNDLLRAANGEYIVFIDDDDDVAPTYVQKILKAIEDKPDCVGISGEMTTNGFQAKQWHISKKYGRWFEDNGVYYRTSNHISPVKRSIALKAMFPEVSFAEDHAYSMRLLPLIKSEVVIPGNIYHYKFISRK